MSSVISSRCDVAVADVGVWRARVYILSSAADEITDKVTDKVTAENTAEGRRRRKYAHENTRTKIRALRAREPANAPEAGEAQVSDHAP